MSRNLIVGIALLWLGVAPAWSAESAQDFYKGKTITYIVATSPGGGYDSYGRLVARYMNKYLPGSKIIIRNMPGARARHRREHHLRVEARRSHHRHFQHRAHLPAVAAGVGRTLRSREDELDRQGRLRHPRAGAQQELRGEEHPGAVRSLAPAVEAVRRRRRLGRLHRYTPGDRRHPPQRAAHSRL